MYHRTVCKNPSLTLSEKDIQDVVSILKEMIKPGSIKKYAHYTKYQEPFEHCLQHIHEINHIENYKTTDVSVPPFIEDDKTLLVKPKSKSILELFSKVKKI